MLQHVAALEPPKGRDQFYIALICALSLEYDAVTLLLDRSYTKEKIEYGRAVGDQNHYTTGCIGRRNVVVVRQPNMGISSATSSASGLRSSFNNLKLCFVVGVCGGVPYVEGEPAFLGDVVISNQVLQIDSGRLYASGFEYRARKIEEVLGRASRDIRGLLSLFESEEGESQLMEDSVANLAELQQRALTKRKKSYKRPDVSSDILFAPKYVHKHSEGCSECTDSPGASCREARETSCEELGCSKAKIIARSRPENDFRMSLGRISSGNQVIGSGLVRDHLAKQHKVIGFEMEGAGTWDELPTIVVKGICDYADSHKNKKWQIFAASTAAAVAKALLEQYVLDDSAQHQRGNDSVQRGNDFPGVPPAKACGLLENRVISKNTFGDDVFINQGNISGAWQPPRRSRSKVSAARARSPFSERQEDEY